ncbi:hypothetical protein EVAR_54352_1 [Eumeta japonica]|uniref:Uncharacterized protein n=1 Tax=Eumeta variegata TaxID=151549 RepID=A0A4C1Z9P4_EUMVA|nr:hypothetical protein EVAR_54352_1 [Eumeta japonica]
MASKDKNSFKAKVHRWLDEFQRGQVKLADEKRNGRSLTAVTKENMRNVYEGPHEQLRVESIILGCIPHNLTPAQKQVRVEWCRDVVAKFKTGLSRRIITMNLMRSSV